MPHESLLPGNATPLERSLALAGDRIAESDALVRDQWSPERAAPPVLPWQAFGMSVDLWNDEWSSDRKAEVVRRSIELHRLKGTLEGARRHVALVDGHILRTLSFGAAAYASPTISKEARNAWLERMPQIRVYLGREKGSRGANAFAGASVAGHAFARFDAGAMLYGRRVTFRTTDGVETRVRRTELVERVEARGAVLERVHLPGRPGRAAFVGGFCGKAALGVVEAEARVVTYALDRSYSATVSELHLETVEPGLDPVGVNYQRVSDIGHAGRAAFGGRFVGQCFAVPSRAEWQLYDRVYLNDRTVDAPWTRAHSFCGTARIGLKPFHAQHMIAAREPVRRRAAFVGRSRVGSAFATQNDVSKVRNVALALRLSKAARDRVSFTTKTRRTRRFGDGIPLDGSFRFGAAVANEL